MSSELSTARSESSDSANIIYILYLVGLATCGLATIIGLIWAYVARDNAPDWLISHYDNQIGIFWKSIAYVIIAIPLCLIGIGFILLALLPVWVIIRCVKGMQRISRGEAYHDAHSWGF